MSVRNDDQTILNLKIVPDNADLEKTHHDKCIYYDVPPIKEWAQSCFEPRHIAFEALAMNWRGLLATRSATALRRLGCGFGVCDLDRQSFQALDLHY